ncbi:hypothetical protein TNCV_2781791 [Trichonephila clavipes]|nr:hypothetical protein TNCV_2781791 [Trichonephila clavipes]
MVDSTFHPYCSGSRNAYQKSLLGDLNTGVWLQIDHLIEASAHAPQRPMVTYTRMGAGEQTGERWSGGLPPLLLFHQPFEWQLDEYLECSTAVQAFAFINTSATFGIRTQALWRSNQRHLPPYRLGSRIN